MTYEERLDFDKQVEKMRSDNGTLDNLVAVIYKLVDNIEQLENKIEELQRNVYGTNEGGETY